MNKYCIYVVEDDPIIARSIREYLQQYGYQVSEPADFHQVLTQFIAQQPQLVIMDIALPFYNGYHWCTEIRKLSKVPLIFLSSASENMNQVMALEMGGDDFVAKPFDLAVLLAKTQALLRRTYDFKTVSTLLSYQDVVLDIAKGQLIFDQQAIELTKNEIKIMEMLMNNPTTIVTRQQLMAKLWASDEYIDDNTLTVNINRLRKKLQLAGLPDFIQTKKGLGYSLGSPC